MNPREQHDDCRVAATEAFKHPAPHVHDGGSVGADETLGSTKLPPVEGGPGETMPKSTLSDEAVDASR